MFNIFCRSKLSNMGQRQISGGTNAKRAPPSMVAPIVSPESFHDQFDHFSLPTTTVHTVQPNATMASESIGTRPQKSVSSKTTRKVKPVFSRTDGPITIFPYFKQQRNRLFITKNSAHFLFVCFYS
ncbi:hypothetical protein AB6A40_008860 [Gnathostoma spinigerum]|uniref:Uncharacterized protein n=1 Tax=Gnathostoma spinigerum TaxID=75299 RepID=A0ABD6EXE5_9BILA